MSLLPTFTGERAASANLLDRMIAVVDPVRAVKRVRARAAYKRLRTYEAASVGRRTATWRTSSSSPNVTIGKGLTKLRARSRDLTENAEYAGGAVKIWTSHLVGTGIRPTPRVATDRGGTDSVVEAHRAAWIEWGESTECDAFGEHNFYGLQRIAQREVVEAGEAIVRRVRRPTSAGLSIPVQLQVLEADHLDTSRDGTTPNGGFILQGVEFDAEGRRVAYWLFPDHPGESVRLRLRLVSQRIPATDVLHVFRTDRAGQARGVPWGASAMLDLKDFDSMTDAQLQRALIASMFVGFVHDIEGGSIADGSPGKASENPLDLEPGTWEDLPPGKDIRFSNPPEFEGYKDFTEITTRQIAKGYDVTYEDLTGDLSGVNFSTARLGRLTFNAGLEEWRELGFQVKLLDPVWRWFTEGADLAGLIPTRLPATWTPPPARLVDPKTEIAVWKEEVRAGFRSLSDVIRKTGQEPRRVLEELSRDLEMLDELGLVLDIDVRANPTPGSPATGGREDTTPRGDPEDPEDRDTAEALERTRVGRRLRATP